MEQFRIHLYGFFRILEHDNIHDYIKYLTILYMSAWSESVTKKWFSFEILKVDKKKKEKKKKTVSK